MIYAEAEDGKSWERVRIKRNDEDLSIESQGKEFGIPLPNSAPDVTKGLSLKVLTWLKPSSTKSIV